MQASQLLASCGRCPRRMDDALVSCNKESRDPSGSMKICVEDINEMGYRGLQNLLVGRRPTLGDVPRHNCNMLDILHGSKIN